MKQIEIYTRYTCPYCIRAKALLNQMNIPFTEYEITGDQSKRDEMILRSHRFTVPQIFIDGQSIGGSDELLEMAQSGELTKQVTHTPPDSSTQTTVSQVA